MSECVHLGSAHEPAIGSGSDKTCRGAATVVTCIWQQSRDLPTGFSAPYSLLGLPFGPLAGSSFGSPPRPCSAFIQLFSRRSRKNRRALPTVFPAPFPPVDALPVLFLKGFRFDKAADGSGAHLVLRRGGGESAGSENRTSEAPRGCAGGTKPAHTPPRKKRKARAVLGGDTISTSPRAHANPDRHLEPDQRWRVHLLCACC